MLGDTESGPKMVMVTTVKVDSVSQQGSGLQTVKKALASLKYPMTVGQIDPHEASVLQRFRRGKRPFGAHVEERLASWCA